MDILRLFYNVLTLFFHTHFFLFLVGLIFVFSITVVIIRWLSR